MGRRRQAFLAAVPVLLVAVVHCAGSTSGADAGRIEEAGADGSEAGADTSNGACPALSSKGEACTTGGKLCSYCAPSGGSDGIVGPNCHDEICNGGTWQIVPSTCDCPVDRPQSMTGCPRALIGCTCAYDGCGSSRRTFHCYLSAPPAEWFEDMPAVPCNDAGM